ncbi:XerC Integrase [uncultured Caudovirales phage]|uniref:Integrase n=1 Tax=uncultured Caudovirales phage TaxID=2100421 RepID=A0A6J5N6A8_9CAUD|nr:XerC Integrase [uncultured Caudovirales phage]
MDARESTTFDPEIVLRDDTYYYRGTPDGLKKRIERTLGLKKGALQRDVLRAKKELVESLERLGSSAGRNNFTSIALRYLEQRELEAKDPTKFSRSSITETRGILKNHLIKYFAKSKIEEINQEEFSDYCKLKKKAGLNLVNHRKVMNHFLKWCTQYNYLRYRPELEIPKFARKEKRQRVVLTDDEIKRLIAACDPQMLLYVSMYLFMGMRNSEILKLKFSEIDFDKKALQINAASNRTRKARVIPINEYVLNILKLRFKDSKSDYVFPSRTKTALVPHLNTLGGIRKPWLKILEASGLSGKITPHDLRATFETHMHINKDFTDSQREKMAGAQIDVQKNNYVSMTAEHLRGLENSVQFTGMDSLMKTKTNEVIGAKRGAKRVKK